jgi:formylglycine-generating enzyme
MMKFVNWLWLLSISQLCAQTPATFTNALGMKFILIQPGQMTVGRFQPTHPTAEEALKIGWSAEEYAEMERQVKRDASPGFPVQIARPYYIGQFEVTQAQWKQVMGRNPSVFQGDKVTDNADEHPIENISWTDAQAFLKKLNALDKGRTYRLPTEFEWEYAARAGATDDIAWADIRAVAQMGLRTTARVGQKKPNAWGLYDTLGNVWEWVQDVYNEKLFADPVPPRSGSQHVLKGASFVGDVKNATYLTHAAGPGNGWDVGFRVVLEVN